MTINNINMYNDSKGDNEMQQVIQQLQARIIDLQDYANRLDELDKFGGLTEDQKYQLTITKDLVDIYKAELEEVQ